MKIERGQKSIKYRHTVPDHVLAYPLRRNFTAQKKTTKFSLAVLPFAVFVVLLDKVRKVFTKHAENENVLVGDWFKTFLDTLWTLWASWG